MKIIKKEIIQKSRFLNFVATRFLNRKGEEDIWYSAERTNGGKTVVVAATVDDKLVVTKEFRIPIGDYEWSLPAGLVDDGEQPEETAKRELKEETNLDMISISNITPYLYNTAGMTNETVSIVFCTANGIVNNHGAELTEDIECFLMDKGQVAELMKDQSKKISAKAYLIFDKYLSGAW